MAKPMSSTDLNQEKLDIFHFISDRMKKDESGRALTSDVFLAYQGWRKGKELPPTTLSIDSFGKLFPHSYMRKVFYVSRVNGGGRWARGFQGISLV